ncbi:helix-turn-helix transcriptional regulator [Dysgonomonas sp. GY75]|uniref:helix-turn-helix domain-containing protein n=1 Tax=Dysgonomonas sp. GY75 TaxID=2780419 RepID=UPI001883D0FB|nr:helix-turn-helix transcriptional regulator [Dysgonomonas sp. GY75]MBF0647363.1 helix-turn-helix transcriptional regulator [Dysgonomonas sp. GY75]
MDKNIVNDTSTQIHHGENVRFVRDVILGWSQEYFASKMQMHQSDVSKLENQEVINDKKLKQIADELNVDVNALKYRNLRNEAKTYIFEIQGDYNVNSSKVINPLEKVSELYERIVDLKEEIAVLKYKLEQADKNK